MPKVFISHSSKDGEFVQAEIVDLLRRHGIDHWYSKDDIGGGDDWVQRIIAALKQCDWFVIVLSPRSVEAKYVRYEVSWAIDNLDNGRIIPVWFEDCTPDKLHFALPFLQHIDFSGRQDLRKARAELLGRWSVVYDDQGGPIRTPPPARPEVRKKPGKRRAVVATSAVAAGLALGVAIWLGRRADPPSAAPEPAGANRARPDGRVTPAHRSASAVAIATLSPTEQANRLVLATLPGLNAKWWFEEARWLAPAFRAAALAAPPGAFAEAVDPWGPDPEDVYDRLRARMADHAETARGRWGWLVPEKGAMASDGEQLAKMEGKVALETGSFRAADWHTLAAIRHHLAAKDDKFAGSADVAYRKAIEAYDREGQKGLKALCLSDYGWLLIDSDFYAQAINQIDQAEGLIRDLGPAPMAQTRLFRAQLRALKAFAYEELSDWASEGRSLDEARDLLGELGHRPAPHPLQAAVCEQQAWMKMWRWDVEAASGLFGQARAMRSHSEHRNAVSYLEKLHDLHGEAMIQRFRGHSRRAQGSLRAILAEIDAKLALPDARADGIHFRNLIDRKFNSLERLADCDLFDGRPALAIKALDDTLGFGRENSLFKGGDRSDEVRLHCKIALAYVLAEDPKNAEQKLKKAMALSPKEEPASEGGARAWVGDKSKLYIKVVDAVVRLDGEGREQARIDIREALRNHEDKLDRDSHELLMLAADLLIASDRVDPEAQASATEDADLLFALIRAIPEDSRDALLSYLSRYHDTALGAKLGDQPGEVADGVKRWAFEAWFGPNEAPPPEKTLLMLHFEEHMGHAILYAPGLPARHFPLKVGRTQLGKPGQPRGLPPELASALEGATALICWRPPPEALDSPFPFDPPGSARFEFPTPAPVSSE